MQKHTELLLLPDGRIFVHNLTPEMAELLQQFDPRDRHMKRRARAHRSPNSIRKTQRSQPNRSYA
jgi:hypothetical protein